MMKIRPLLMLIAAVALTACSDPKDIVLGPDPMKQMAEQGDQFRKLPEQDRQLLAAYFTLHAIGKAFSTDTPTLAGRTVGEALRDAKQWQEKMKIAEEEQRKKQAEADALKKKVLAEQKAVADRISAMVTVAVTDKVVLPENYEMRRFSPLLMIKYAIENKSEKTIRQLKGRVTFRDLTGDEIGWLPVNIDEPIKPGQTLKTDTGRGWRTNSFSNGDIEKIAGREFSSMKASFAATSIALDGGEVIKAPDNM